MRKLSVVMSALLTVGAGSAFADETKKGDNPTPPRTGVSDPSRATQINKHITFVDLYLSSAMINTKALSTLGDADSGEMDAQLIGEARRNLDAALERALAHMKHVREFRGDLAMVSPGIEPSTGSNAAPRPAAGQDRLAKLDHLESQLRDARTASKKLAGATLEDLAPAVDGVSTHLVAAQQSFRDLAKWTSYTMLEDSNLATVPVKGTSDRDIPPAGPVDRDVGSVPPEPTQVTPAAPTDVDKARGKTIPGPSKPEPVNPAPGGGY